MKYIGWKKREVSVMDPMIGRSISQVTDLYVFNNPELVYHNKYDEDIVRVHPKNHANYEHWHMNKGLEKKESVLLVGIGIHKDCLFEVGKIDLLELSEKIGIKRGQLDSILSNS